MKPVDLIYRAIINKHNTQSTEYYKADISKYISFPITLVLLKYMLFLNPVYFAIFMFEVIISALFNVLRISIPFPIQARSVLELQVCSYWQYRLNVALTM